MHKPPPPPGPPPTGTPQWAAAMASTPHALQQYYPDGGSDVGAPYSPALSQWTADGAENGGTNGNGVVTRTAPPSMSDTQGLQQMLAERDTKLAQAQQQVRKLLKA